MRNVQIETREALIQGTQSEGAPQRPAQQESFNSPSKQASKRTKYCFTISSLTVNATKNNRDHSNRDHSFFLLYNHSDIGRV